MRFSTGSLVPLKSGCERSNTCEGPSMAIPALARDFKEFLKSLNSNRVEYLLIGGYAVAVHGHVRATNDLDIWVGIHPDNAKRIDRALREFGFASPILAPNLFLAQNKVVRMGLPPVRIEILTSISGVEFEPCYAERETIQVEEIVVPVISLARLRQ